MNIIVKLIGAVNIVRVLEISDWPIHFLINFGIIKKTDVTYNFRNGIKLKGARSSMHDEPGFYFDYIFKNECYSPPDLPIRENDIVVDIGAHIGTFSIYAAKKAKHGRVYAYEPMKENFNLLMQNIKLNSLNNVILFNLGIAGKSGKRDFYLAEEPESHNLFCPTARSTEIECITLKEVFNSNNLEKIDFLKFNCEGAEYEILFNTPAEFIKKINIISLSFHTESNGIKDFTQKDLIEFFQRNNFTLLKPTKDKCQKQNIIYARNNFPVKLK